MRTQVTAIAAAAAVIVALTAVDGWAQSGARALSHTPWGHPDLQGIWNNSTTTPLEQLTDEERAQDRAARRPVIEATRGTGAAWPEQKGRLEQPSLIVDPPDGRMSMTMQAVQRLIDRENARAGRGESDSWLDRNSWERCLTRTLPVAMIPNLYNANYQILQTPDHVVLVMEMIHEARIIPLDGGPHASDRIRQWLGDSRGHWEGDTLVIESSHFNDRSAWEGSSRDLKVLERFTRVSDDRIHYEFTVEDPATWDQPWSAEIPMMATEGPMYEYACHEGNHDIRHIQEVYRNIELQEAPETR